MFNGLIRDIGRVKSFDGRILRVHSSLKARLGDSIAVNGACLSVVELMAHGFSLEVSSESAHCLALENFKNAVHLEPAIRFGERIDGHLMQGHIDALGVIEAIIPNRVGVDIIISTSQEAMRFIVPKGSIAIEGVSLTVNDIMQRSFRLTIIPLSYKETLFSSFVRRRRVHIETDMMVRNLAHLLRYEKVCLNNTANELEELMWAY